MKKLFVTVMIITICNYFTDSFVWAEDLYNQKFQFGIRGGTFLADGEPANDLPMYGIYGRYSYHIADWKVTDRISGNAGSIENYSTYGFYLGVGFRF